jgi:hypothetical protein
MDYKFGEITIGVERTSAEYVWNQYKNNFEITISNEDGKSLSRKFDIYNKDKIEELDNKLLESLLKEIVDCYYITSSEYPIYEYYCDDFGLELNDEEEPPQQRVFAAAVTGSTIVALEAVLVVVLFAS